MESERSKLLDGLEDCASKGLNILQAATYLRLDPGEIFNLMVSDPEVRQAYDRGLTKKHLYYIARMEEEEASNSKSAHAARVWLLNHFEKNHQTIARFTPIPQIGQSAETEPKQITDSRIIDILVDYNERQKPDDQ